MKRIVALLLIAALLGCGTKTDALFGIETDAALAYIAWCRDMENDAAWRKYDRLKGEAEARIYPDEPALLPLLREERALVRQYDLLPVALRIEMFGKTWTGDAILSDPTLDRESFDALYAAYMAQFNAAAGAIFLDLLAVRKRIAAVRGFDSYTAYRYGGRDETPDDAAAFCARVKAAFVPLIEKRQAAFYLAAGRLYGAAFEPEPTAARVGEAIVSLLPELSEPWNTMVSRDLYDLGTGPDRLPGAFVQYLPAERAPYLFLDWTGGFESPAALARAFGRYAALYQGEDRIYNGGASDLVEIDAQGLELLTVLRYDTIYGELSRAAETAELYFALYTLLDGCAEDAFLRYAFSADAPTVAELNGAYGRICTEYGLTAYGEEPRSWTRDPDLFRLPDGIGKAVGAIAALELYLLAKREPKAAIEAYRALLNSTDVPVRRALNGAGLFDPFRADTPARIADGLSAEGNRE